MHKIIFFLGFFASIFVFVFGIYPALSQERQVERRTDFPTESPLEFGTPWTGSGVEGPRREMEKEQFDQTVEERRNRREQAIEAGDLIEEMDFYFEQQGAYREGERRVDRQVNLISTLKVHDDARQRLVDALGEVEEVIEDAEKNMESVSCFIKRLHDKTAAGKAPPLNLQYCQ